MGQVSASSSVTVDAAPQAVLAALSDYETVRPRILSEHYRDYRLVSGGHGDGTVAEWTLQATSKRSRNVTATVAVAGNTITETDGNSSMVTRWTVVPSGSGSEVTTKTEWTGAGGIGGFFEKTFAPLGLKKIQAEVLANLSNTLA
ncbi:SRPBCC family protein [Antrihabitans sp. YC3-6]|uniref:SRPBCC family protein n=1 Tax=Antrihabitans stalagmiti TaxID=2799499 RepID=A0A934U4S3_9NOCA|nr:SRPBCC family protein [Antrihabitans stalagmiti]MBJ8340083.1 SRPBCC family protein [Antrihabitans stalagmiti]